MVAAGMAATMEKGTTKAGNDVKCRAGDAAVAAAQRT